MQIAHSTITGIIAALMLLTAPLARASDGSGALDGLVQQESGLTTFVAAVEAAGLTRTLTGASYTAFAPSDQAFDDAGLALSTLLKSGNVERLLDLLRAHLVADDVDIAMALKLGTVTTLDGGTVDIYNEGDRLMVDNASVLRSGLRQGGLRVYIIDRVLGP